MLLCFNLAGETTFSASKHPTTFCYRYNPKQYKSIAHTVCFPTLCLKEQHKVLSNKFQEIKFYNLYWKIFLKQLQSNLTSR